MATGKKAVWEWKIVRRAALDAMAENFVEEHAGGAARQHGHIAFFSARCRAFALPLGGIPIAIKDNINVTAIAPGAFKSDMNRAARDHSDEVAQRIPAKRIGTDEDMAGIAIYLASRAGDYVVGNTIAVDGGVVYANAGLEIAG